MGILNCRFECNGDNVKGKTVLVLCPTLFASHQLEETAPICTLNLFHLIFGIAFVAVTFYTPPLTIKMFLYELRLLKRLTGLQLSLHLDCLMIGVQIHKHFNAFNPFRSLICIFISFRCKLCE